MSLLVEFYVKKSALPKYRSDSELAIRDFKEVLNVIDDLLKKYDQVVAHNTVRSVIKAWYNLYSPFLSDVKTEIETFCKIKPVLDDKFESDLLKLIKSIKWVLEI